MSFLPCTNTEKEEAPDGSWMFPFRVRVGGELTGQRLPHLDKRQFGITVALKVRCHLSNPLFRLAPERFRVHNRQPPDRIRQRIGRIGKAGWPHFR
jgi:hypothetical protein